MADLLQWWYFRGWGVFVGGFKRKMRDGLDFFSISQLLRTLFKPFRQIAANTTSEDMAGSRLAAFFDRLVSRIVGFFARLFIIIFGGFALLCEMILGIAAIIIWPFLPILVIVGVVMTIMGVVI